MRQHHFKKFLAICLALVFWDAAPANAQLVINELMQSNIDCVMDDLKEYPDSWVELYNTGSTGVKLNQYKIGVTENAAEAWALPNQTIGGKQHVLVCCDKEAKKLHTDFRLESGKGMNIYLFKDGKVVDKVTELLKQPAPNISYGRETDGSEAWGYQLTPTPSAANKGGICEHDHILGTPVFSEPGRVYANQKDITLTLSLPEGSPEGTIIRYTTDGSDPSDDSNERHEYTQGETGFSATGVSKVRAYAVKETYENSEIAELSIVMGDTHDLKVGDLESLIQY